MLVKVPFSRWLISFGTDGETLSDLVSFLVFVASRAGMSFGSAICVSYQAYRVATGLGSLL